MSQSTISIQIRKLEEDLKCKLIQRGPRIYELTEEGRVTFDYCQGIFAQGRDLVRALKSGQPKQAVMCIGFENHVSQDLKKNVLQSLTRLQEFIFNVELGSDSDWIRRLSTRQVDVAVSNSRPSPNAERGLKIRLLTSSSLVLVGKKKWRRKKGVGTPDLTNVPLFLPPAGSLSRQVFEHWSDQKKLLPCIRVESRDESLLKAMALMGNGVSLLHRSLVKLEVKTNGLEVLHEFRGQEPTHYALSLEERENDPKLARVLKNLTSLF